MKNVLLTIEYDGTNFCGWQKQPGQRSVQGELERVLSTICTREIKLNGTSRTDAGVHAYGQRASFEGDFGIPTDRIKIAANNLLSGAAIDKGRSSIGTVGDVRITEVQEVPMGFHARFDATGKKYIYKIRNTKEPDIFSRNSCYQVAKPLNVDDMRKAAALMVGTHDFKCFQAAGGKELQTTVRTIFDITISTEGSKNGEFPCNIEIAVSGDGFLYNMVRIISGTLVDVGTGKLKAEWVPKIIEGKNRQMAGHTAPPQGLYLAEVYYNASVENFQL